jgi:hypothetical protein
MLLVRNDTDVGIGVFLAALTVGAIAMTCPAAGQNTPPPSSQPANAAAIAQYQKDLAAYQQARQTYKAATSAYWNSIAQQRQIRNTKRVGHTPIVLDDYVLSQPPIYSGPPAPINPVPPPSAPSEPSVAPKPIPVVADFLAAAKTQFNFMPQAPQQEIDFKRTYAKVAAAAGLTKDQVVRIYGFEATGNGTYQVQAGLEYGKPGEHAVSTALGYNQLLATNSVELMAEQGDQFVKALTTKAATLPGPAQQSLDDKIAVVEAMVAFSKSVPDDWGRHQILAATPKGLGIHAMNLDIDVGPLLQTQKLLNSVLFAHANGLNQTLTGAALEMMNLTGDGNGFDLNSLPQAWRQQVPTSNYFDQGGYEDNPVVERNNVVATLLAATDAQMDDEVKKPGAIDLARCFPIEGR